MRAVRCQLCGISFEAPQVAELRWIDGEFARLDTEAVRLKSARDWLVNRRVVLLAELAERVAEQPAARPENRPRLGGTPVATSRVTELSGRTAARLLLGTGALLVMIAAAAFTAANWGSIGALGRCAILLGVTAVTAAVPATLRRRSLAATAEAVAAIALALTVADGYLVWQLVRPGWPGHLFVIAAAVAVLAGLWAGYGTLTGLRCPQVAAIGLAQFPGLIFAVSLVHTLGGGAVSVVGPLACTAVLTCGADLLLIAWLNGGRLHAEQLAASLAAAATWTAGVFLASVGATGRPGLGTALWFAAALALASVVAMLMPTPGTSAWLSAPAVSAFAGVLLAAALAVPAAAALPDGWFAVTASSAALVASTAAWRSAGRMRQVALAGAACGVLGGFGTQWRTLVLAMVSPYQPAMRPWQQHGLATARPALELLLPVVALVAGLAATATAVGAWRGTARASLNVVAIVPPIVVGPIALAWGLDHPATLGLLLAVAIALAGWAAASRSYGPAGAALASFSLALAWALAGSVPTLIVLGCLAAASMLCAWRAPRAVVRVAASVLAVLGVAALAECLVLAVGRPAWQSGLAVLGVAACAQAAAGRLAAGRPEAGRPGAGAGLPGAGNVIAGIVIAVEVTAWVAVAAGLAQCLSRSGPASVALALAGVLCLGVAVRRDRRPVLWAGLALGEAAWCVWLSAAGVTMPELYVLPASAAALVAGWRLTLRRPQVSSWLSYGPGLTWLLLPSLVTLWQGQGWIRPLLLGSGAAAVTVAGARRRLQAPLLLGAVTAVLVAGHELAPAIRQLAEQVPGWLPVALAGAILLWAGARYEAWLGNLKTVGRSVVAMR
ncbi:MAG TPA: hypothetical protein VNF47_01490 [Streptosporangiaceae bacterium]|nr:hypothetical protein [Streptosporangiaceae bacterium]